MAGVAAWTPTEPQQTFSIIRSPTPYSIIKAAGFFRNHNGLILNIEAVRKRRAAGEEIFLLTFTRFSRTATQLPLNMIAVSCFSSQKSFMLHIGYH